MRIHDVSHIGPPILPVYQAMGGPLLQLPWLSRALRVLWDTPGRATRPAPDILGIYPSVVILAWPVAGTTWITVETTVCCRPPTSVTYYQDTACGGQPLPLSALIRLPVGDPPPLPAASVPHPGFPRFVCGGWAGWNEHGHWEVRV